MRAIRAIALSGRGEFVGTAPRWNPADKDSKITLSNSDITATRSTTSPGSWCAVRGLTSRSSGKWYAELRNDANGSTNGALIFGLATAAASLTSYIGSNSSSWGIQANNTGNLSIYSGGSQTAQGNGTNSIGAGGRAMVAYDAATGKIWLGSNGTWFGGGNPSAGTGANYTIAAGTALFLALSESNDPQQCSLRNGVGENIFTIPSGFSMWQ